MVGLDGIEPSTSRLSGVRSNQTELQALGHTPSATLYRPGLTFPVSSDAGELSNCKTSLLFICQRAILDLSKLNSDLKVGYESF